MNVKISDGLRHISPTDVKEYRKAFEADKQNNTLKNTVNSVGIEKAGINRDSVNRTNHLFSKKVDDWEVMDQKQSGRCWIFAGMNLYKPSICKKLKVKDIKLSANFVQFWDFFEKANLFLNNIELTADKPLDDRLVHHILSSGHEGGWWDMFAVLVKKYGIVPEQAMPETPDASRPAPMCRILSSFLRLQARELRTLIENKASIAKLKDFKKNTLKDVYRLLCIHLGTPPGKFSWTYENKDKKVITLKNMTPLSFISRFDSPECVTLINDPRKERPYMEHYTSEFTGSIFGEYVDFLNVDIATIKKLVRKMIDSGRSVWMSCDVHKMADHSNGIFADDLYNFSDMLNLPEPLKKADRLDYSDGGGNHAMLFTGYHEEGGKITKWRIENSWGEKNGKKGFYELTDKWFDEHVYTSLISKEFLSKKLLKVLDKPPITVMPWELPY